MNFLFNRKPASAPIVVQPPAESRVEVELHKNASEDAAEKAKKVNKYVQDLLIENGFTLKIYLAAGGEISTKKRGGNQ